MGFNSAFKGLITCYEYHAIARYWQQGNVLYKRRHLFKNVNYATDVNLRAPEWVRSTPTMDRPTESDYSK